MLGVGPLGRAAVSALAGGSRSGRGSRPGCGSRLNRPSFLEWRLAEGPLGESCPPPVSGLPTVLQSGRAAVTEYLLCTTRTSVGATRSPVAASPLSHGC